MGYYYDLKDSKLYCQSRIRKLIKEQNSKTIWYDRGQYVGYKYGLTIVSFYKNQKVKSVVLYKVIKYQKNNVQYKYIKEADYQKGMSDGLYDLMNYITRA